MGSDQLNKMYGATFINVINICNAEKSNNSNETSTWKQHKQQNNNYAIFKDYISSTLFNLLCLLSDNNIITPIPLFTVCHTMLSFPFPSDSLQYQTDTTRKIHTHKKGMRDTPVVFIANVKKYIRPMCDLDIRRLGRCAIWQLHPTTCPPDVGRRLIIDSMETDAYLQHSAASS